ncbi:carboxylesterase family protein [Umezawaea endophytica]|uniref:Carboxylic ester hydrolase n=1 Tax=Umezawaea endophytica TaxID=1654476 RepID=A0A9X2VMP8_9PSEU|nr:carboxylesterase family protein [Umezawaea endophytica]MCS7479481.1 carboxylesterase family protein [Umezawaea endophytica]
MKISTTSGVVSSDTGVFHGVPYAAPPVGAGRFAAPAPPVPWSGVRDASTSGPSAPAPDRRWFGKTDMGPFMGVDRVAGDDYLTVTVSTPDTAGSAPVMVFVHGGGFLSGTASAPGYDGSAFTRDGIVLVALNYRLGAPGWVSLPGAPDNRGALDVLAALGWVRDNIANFGGDPDRVTLFGHSAGAMVVGSLAVDPAARGLFHRAISQSGGLVELAPEDAAKTAADLAGLLGIEPTPSAFAAVPDERLIDAVGRLRSAGLAGVTPFGPVRAGHEGTHVADLLVGTATEEARLYQDPSRSAAIDALFETGKRRLVEAHGDALTYEFDWRGGTYGACHGVELPFVFETTELPALRGSHGLLGPDVPPSLAAEVHGAWVRFATTGDPGWTGHHRFTA